MIKNAPIPYIIPSKRPAITSVGKCTVRYNLETPISTASTTAGIPHFLFWVNMATAAATLAEVCPEGNDESEGSFTSIVCKNEGSATNGRVRFTRFFIIRLVNISDNTRETAIVIPIFLVRLKNKSTTARAIQKQPALPRKVRPFITGSSTGL